MKLVVKGNVNYCATIVEIEKLIELEGCDSIQGTLIFGNHVIVSNNTKIGDVGVYFPVETAIKPVFLNANNLYRNKELNSDNTKSGFFELNGRVRCMKLRGFKSEGFFIPISSLEKLGSFSYIKDIDVGVEFDTINGELICEKYVNKKTLNQDSGNKKSKTDKKLKRFNKMIEGQFHFHIDTTHLGRNIHKINEGDVISITRKMHGTSSICSNILCKKQLTRRDKIAKFFGVHILDKDYENIYSSRKVIKNKFAVTKDTMSFYKENIWGTVDKELEPYLEKGMTIYSEIVGYLSTGKAIQGSGKKIFDYGCEEGKHETYIYRITTTNADGKVYEWSMLQLQQWCKEKGLNAVPLLYYGTAKLLYAKLYRKYIEETGFSKFDNYIFLDLLTKEYLEKDCSMSIHNVPDEGIVLRKEILEIEAYKHKSFKFLNLETKQLDSGEENIEESQSEES